MIDKHDALYKDFDAISKISIVPAMLDVVCRLTGLGFAAVARVTEDRWLACSVKDEVNFGLPEGGELEIKTTLCNEIRGHKEAIVIDHVEKDKKYKDHHTPRIYGLQSYISFPIILQSGEFFGTLCAIGTQPANLSDPKVTGTFKLFSELLSFHIQSIELMEQSHLALRETKGQLLYSAHENLLYQQISDHNLQEPLRKIAVFSDLLISHAENTDLEKIKKTASQINVFANELSSTIQNITKFSTLKTWDASFEPVDLGSVVEKLHSELKTDLDKKNIKISFEKLPLLSASEEQMKQVFFQLIRHSITFSKPNAEPEIRITSARVNREEIKSALPSEKNSKFSLIKIVMTEMQKQNLATLFDILIHLKSNNPVEKYGNGLADCRKIIFNHGGVITAQTSENQELVFSILLPVNDVVEEYIR